MGFCTHCLSLAWHYP
uniref:Uncharacterized protein n=1 Tax=Anguilla anguilla TaxID=7936 RepID=A0A0E9QR76_ANGAN